jgi:hypothetical protein
MEWGGFGYVAAGNPYAFEGGQDFARTGGEGAFEGGPGAGVINRTEGLETPRRPGREQGIGARARGAVEQAAEEIRVERRHVARHHEIPCGAGVGEGGENAAQRALAGVQIGDHRESQYCVQVRIAHQDRATGRLEDGASHRFDQGPSAKRQQGFIAAHAGTAAARQHESHPGAARRRTLGPYHTEMITLNFAVFGAPWSETF